MKPELGQCVKASRFRPQSLNSTCYFYLQPTKLHLYPHECLWALRERGLQQWRAQSDTEPVSTGPSGNINISSDFGALWSGELCNQEFLRCFGVCCFCSWKYKRHLFTSAWPGCRPSSVLTAPWTESTETFVKWCCFFGFHLIFSSKSAGSVQTEHILEALLL